MFNYYCLLKKILSGKPLKKTIESLTAVIPNLDPSPPPPPPLFFWGKKWGKHKKKGGGGGGFANKCLNLIS